MRSKLLATIGLLGILSIGAQGSVIYQQDFESIGTGDTLTWTPWKWSIEGWNTAVGEANGGTYVWGYYPAENPNPNIYEVETGQAGPGQGNNTLRSYADYGADYNSAGILDTRLLAEYTISAADAALGTIQFTFDYKNIDIQASTKQFVFLRVLNSIGGDYSTLAVDDQEVFASDANWTGGSISVDVSALSGQLLQWGTSTQVSQWEPSAIGVDNINIQSIPEPATMAFFGLFGGAMLFLRRRYRN